MTSHDFNLDVTKRSITAAIREALAKRFNDPVVELTEPQLNTLVMRVAGRRGPRYFTVKVVENI